MVPQGGAARADFSGVVDGTIEGIVFNDFNADGVRQRGEPPVSGAAVIPARPRSGDHCPDDQHQCRSLHFHRCRAGRLYRSAGAAGWLRDRSGRRCQPYSRPLPGAFADVGMRRIGVLSGRVFIYQTNDPSVVSPLANISVTLDGPGGPRTVASSVSGAYQSLEYGSGCLYSAHPDADRPVPLRAVRC